MFNYRYLTKVLATYTIQLAKLAPKDPDRLSYRDAVLVEAHAMAANASVIQELISNLTIAELEELDLGQLKHAYPLITLNLK